MVSLSPSFVFKKEKGEVLDKVQTVDKYKASLPCHGYTSVTLQRLAWSAPTCLSSAEKRPCVPGITEQKAR